MLRLQDQLEDDARLKPPETLETLRLRLRRPRMTDADAVLRFGSDPEVTKFMTWPRHVALRTVHAFLQSCAAAWASGEEFTWMLTLKPDDTAMGTLGCRLRRDAMDFGFVLERGYWGRGLATEAAHPLVRWAWEVGSVRRVWATCDAENLASARVLQKLGLHHEGLLPGGLVRPNLGPEPRSTLVFGEVRHG